MREVRGGMRKGAVSIRAESYASKLTAMNASTRILARASTRGGIGVALVTFVLLAATVAAPAQSGQQLTLSTQASAAKRNQRLILKDGSYQRVREYKIVGDRVRYISTEREGAGEELPANLVDWAATRKWEQAQPSEEPSPAMKEAQAIDKEELDDQKARSPEVMPGLALPDEDGVFALDHYEGKPELVELVSSDLNTNQKTRRGVGLLNPLAALKMNLELDGAHARVHLHTGAPVLYLSLAGREEAEPGFALVRLDERRAVRVVGAIHLGLNGKVTQSENVIPTKAEVLEGQHWLRIEPTAKLAVGEYALVEILSPEEMNQSVWDFRVDPASGGNPGSLTPILKDGTAH
jgi:hypothetical protein